jgi:hypothetical protein
MDLCAPALLDAPVEFRQIRSPWRNAIIIPANAAPAMYPDAISTPALLSPSAVKLLFCQFLALNLIRK